MRAAHKIATAENPRTDSCADHQRDDVLLPTRCAAPCLTEDNGIAIALDEDRRPEFASKQLRQRNALPVRNVWRPHGSASAHESWNGDTHRVERFALGDADNLRDGIGFLNRLFDAIAKLPFRIDESRGDFRSAEIDGQHGHGAHDKRGAAS